MIKITNGPLSRSVKETLKFPDHYAILLKLKDIPMKPPTSFVTRKQVIWNTKRKSGWEKYEQKTENNPVFMKVSNMEEESAESVLKVIEKELNSVKYACFGKIKVSSKNKNERKLEDLQAKKISMYRH